MTVLCVALLVRLCYVPFAPQIDPLLKNEGELRRDAMSYDAIGWNLARGQGYTHPDPQADINIYPPLYPFVLAGVYKVFGHSLVPVRLVQAVLGALTCTFLSLIGFRLGGAAGGWLAGLGLAFHPLYLGFTAWISTETLYLFFFVLALFFWVKLGENPTWQGAVALGLAWGVAALARPAFAIAPVLFLLWGLAVLRPRLKAAGLTLLLVVCLYAAQAPWLIYRSVGRQQVTLTSREMGSSLLVTLWRINNPYADGGESTDLALLVSDLNAWEALSPSQQNREALRSMTNWIITRPHEYLLNCGKRLLKFFSPFEFGATAIRRGASFPLSMSIQIPILVAYGVYLVMALVGLVSSFKEWRGFLPLYLAFGYFLAFHVLIWSAFTRYSMPAMTIVVVWAACGVAWLFGRLRGRQAVESGELAA